MNGLFGKPKYDSDRGSSRKNFKLTEDQPLEFRIIPPIKSLAARGEWSKFHRVHFGYAGVDRNNPDKGKPRPFECVEVSNRARMVLETCPECELIAENKKQLLDREMALRQRNASQEEIDTMLAPLRNFERGHNLSKKFYLNIMDKSGDMGVLQLSYTCMQQELGRCIKEAKDQGVDPIDPEQGVWFRATRTGKGLKTKDAVALVYETQQLNGRPVRSLKLAPLSHEQALKAVELPDLATEVTTKISRQQIQQLVDSSRDPEEVDRIFASGQSREASERSPAPAIRHPQAQQHVQQQPPAPQHQHQQQAAPPAQHQAPPPQAHQQQPPPQAAAPAQAPAAADANVDVRTMSAEDFMARFSDRK